MFDVLGRITELREERGWSVYRVAKNAGIPQSSMNTWYTKKATPPIDAVEKICRAFDISLADFFDDKKEARRETSLAILRRQRGFSQKDLAERTGIPLEIICAYEQRDLDIRNASYAKVKRIAEILGFTIDEVVEED
jgi:transcriptional regulator with XRE-family HTH domain